MQSTIVGLLAETFIHSGCGRDTGVVDLPVAREAATDYPFIAGSGMKGAFKDWANQNKCSELDHLFGEPDKAGQLLVSDARLLLLPVRSLTGNYRWATCRHLLERLLRDLRRCGNSSDIDLPEPADKTVFTSGEGDLYLEERNFEIVGPPQEAVIELLETVMPHPETAGRLKSQLAILSDVDFAWFARYGLAVQARNFLEKGTKKSKNLWYEETLPPDTLMYCVLSGRSPAAIEVVAKTLRDDCSLQAGGNETVGQGWFSMTQIEKEAADA